MRYRRGAGWMLSGAGAVVLAGLCVFALDRDAAQAYADDDAPIATGLNDWAAPELAAAAAAAAEPSPALQPEPERLRAEAVEAEILDAQTLAAAHVRHAAARLPKLDLTAAADAVLPSLDARDLAFAEPRPPREMRVEVSRPASPESGRRSETGRVYAFAAVKGDAAGMVLRGRAARAAEQPRWAVEKIASIGDVQLGVGWRKGAVQASLALVDREISIKGFETRENFFAFTVSVKPRKAKAVRRV